MLHLCAFYLEEVLCPSDKYICPLSLVPFSLFLVLYLLPFVCSLLHSVPLGQINFHCDENMVLGVLSQYWSLILTFYIFPWIPRMAIEYIFNLYFLLILLPNPQWSFRSSKPTLPSHCHMHLIAKSEAKPDNASHPSTSPFLVVIPPLHKQILLSSLLSCEHISNYTK